jgi:hypothetical protein
VWGDCEDDDDGGQYCLNVDVCDCVVRRWLGVSCSVRWMGCCRLLCFRRVYGRYEYDYGGMFMSWESVLLL